MTLNINDAEIIDIRLSGENRLFIEVRTDTVTITDEKNNKVIFALVKHKDVWQEVHN